MNGWRLIHVGIRSARAVLPTGVEVAIDESGVSEPVDEESANQTATVPGWEIFSTPATVPGEVSGLPGSEPNNSPEPTMPVPALTAIDDTAPTKAGSDGQPDRRTRGKK